jgi:TRAP-type C4-dicarboxylate transport system substrate-binding protein
MKTLRFLTLSAAAVLLLGAALPARAQQIVLKLHHMLPATSNPHLNVLVPWCEKINKESNDRLKCQIYPAMQLGGTPPQLFDQVRDGVVDLTWTVPTYSAGRFSKSEVFELPFMAHSAKAGSQALWQYVQKNALDEFKGVRPLFMHVHDGSMLHFTKQPVKNLDDLKGLKIRAATRINARMLQALGATPVQMPLPQVPEALSKGVIDGAMVPWEGVPVIKLQEITKFHLITSPAQNKMSNTIFAFAMNQAKYDSLAPDLKKAIDANSGIEWSAIAGRAFDATVGPNSKDALGRGNKMNVLSDAEYKRLQAASESVNEEWMKEVAAKGGDGKALLNAARELLQKYTK